MFLEHRPTIQKFQSMFHQEPDGSVGYLPPKESIAMPMSLDEYFELVAIFRRNHRIGMAQMWFSNLVGSFYGGYRYLRSDQITDFLLIFGIGMGFGILCLFRANLHVPFWLARDFLAWKAELPNAESE
jgi:hypothetical protein